MDAHRFFYWLSLFWLLSTAPLQAAVVLVVPERLPLTAALATSISRDAGFPADIITLNELPQLQPERYRAAVLVGPDVLSQWQQPGLPAVALFVSREQVDDSPVPLVSAIYNDPPLSRQLALARLIVGADAPLGVLVRDPAQLPFSAERLQALKVRVFVTDGNDVQRVLQNLLLNTQALVALPDAELFSADNIKNILISAYRQNRPMIGPGVSYLRVGALASTFSNTAEVSQRLVEILRAGLQQGQWPAADYNPYFSVRINEQVGRSLNMQIEPAARLTEQLRQQERLPQ